MIVRIWHNESPDHYFGYEYGHRLIEVFAYRLGNRFTDLASCDLAYHLFNVGHDPEFGEPHPFAMAYRMAGHRSLSVGDVVQVDSRFYACESSGWRVLENSEMAETVEAK